jgi:hypothetical protein
MANIVCCLTNDTLFERSKSESSSCSKVKSLLAGCVSQQVSVFVHMNIPIARKYPRFYNGRLLLLRNLLSLLTL